MISKIYSGIEVKCNEEDLNKQNVIYCFTFENGKTYIGQTKNMLRNRLSKHCCYNNGCTKLRNAIKKYKSFTVSILESNLTISQLNSFEQFYIRLFDSNTDNGYNLESGGINKLLSQETKLKISTSLKFHKVSDETKRKLSKYNKNNKNATKKVKSIPDNLIFDSVKECEHFYNTYNIYKYYNGDFDKKSHQTFILIS